MSLGLGGVLLAPLSPLELYRLKRGEGKVQRHLYKDNAMPTINRVMKRFNANSEHKLWNMLTRTSIHPVFMSHRLNAIWFLSFIWRWCWLLPLRVMVFMFSICWLIFATILLMVLPKSVSWYNTAYEWMMKLFFRLITHSFSAVINFHYPENKAKKGGICVANHTSPLDAVILSYDNCYSLIGQRHGGFLGFIMMILDQTCSHIWFERHESKDRQMVIDRLQAHCSNKESRPVLIFPEGTCINNTSVMMFKKGSFEIDTIIYPVAIKYNTLYTEAFWNSSEQSIVRYLFMMLTSWALVCNVWYLPPMVKGANEDAITFANRVKSLIATQGGLVDLQWDGMIKRKQLSQKIKESLMDRERRVFLAQSNYLPRTLSSGNLLANLQAAHASSNNLKTNNLKSSKSAHNLSAVIDTTEIQAVVDSTETQAVVDSTETQAVIDSTETQAVVDSTETQAVVDSTETQAVVDSTETQAVVDTADS